MSEDAFDLIVIGSGPGGYIAALHAAHLGLKTACVEKDATFGGTCLNVGCIPSKSLLESSHHFRFIQTESKEHGIEISAPRANFQQMMKRKEEVVASLVKGIEGLFKGAKVTPLTGTATFTSPQTIEVNGKTYTAKNFIIATGSEPTPLPFLPFDEKKILSSTGALSLSEIPKTLTVIGAGVIGVELASVYQRLGTEVAIIEMLDTICPAMDPQVSKTLLTLLKKQGIKFFLSSKVTEAKGTTLSFTQNGETHTLTSDYILVAVGRRPYTKDLGLEAVGIATDAQGFIPVDQNFRTVHPHIYAIGDAITGVMLAHRASDEGMAAVDLIAGLSPKVHYIAIPNIIYTHPEVAALGFNENEVDNPVVHTSPFKANARARCAGDTDGFVKIISDKESKRLLGIHIIGPHASEMIGEGVIALLNKMRIDELARAPHAHPTLCEAIKEASLC